MVRWALGRVAPLGQPSLRRVGRRIQARAVAGHPASWSFWPPRPHAPSGQPVMVPFVPAAMLVLEFGAREEPRWVRSTHDKLWRAL